jgi:hypothetical protein
MILEKGNIWDMWGKTDLFLFTANSTLKTNGRLVMGKGIALEVRNKIPDIDLDFGMKLDRIGSTYGVMTHIAFNQMIGAFQVKYNWKHKADRHLIMNSCCKLFYVIVNNNLQRVDLNFPGIGNGGLKREEVLPIVSYLPDCVHIWEHE